MTGTPAIEFRNISKTYSLRNKNEINALSDFSLSVPEGQIFGFAGPNGAGKSTAIKILLGLLRPTEGHAKIFNLPAGNREAKNLVGYLPEITLYHEFMKARELLAIHATLAGVASSEIKNRCEEALEKVGLRTRQNSYIKEFSKGMKQRFGIAQAIVGSPKLLILDELTSGLDPKAQHSLLELLESLRNQGMTIFFSSHHLREIEKVCDSIAIIHRGTLRCAGTMKEVLGEEKGVSIEVKFEDNQLPKSLDLVWETTERGHSTEIATADISPILIKIAEHGAQILSLESSRKPLEEIFHELTFDSLEENSL